MPGATLTYTDEAGETQTVELAEVTLSDSRAQMSDFTNIAKALGLSEDADEQAILAKLDETPSLDPAKIAEALGIEATGEEAILTAIASKDSGEVDIEKAAKDKGLKVVKADDYDTLVSDAAAGKKAADELHQAKFTDAFDKALSDGKVDAKPETRERFQKLYDADAEVTLDTLKGLSKVVSTEAKGSGENTGDAPEGVDQTSYEIDRATKARMAEDKSTYEEALDKVLAERSAS